MSVYFNVPSDWPLTAEEAYKKAVDRFGCNKESARDDHAGITWQSDHGQQQFADWNELPAASSK